jgi:hypothetical protein
VVEVQLLQNFRNFFKDQAVVSEVNFFQPVFIIFVEAMLEHLNLPTDFSIHSVNGTRGETVVCMKDGEAKTVVGYSDVSIEFEGRTDIGELKPPFKETGLFHTAARQPKDQYIMQQQIFKSSGFLTDSIAICAGLCTVDGERTNHLLTGGYMEKKKVIINFGVMRKCRHAFAWLTKKIPMMIPKRTRRRKVRKSGRIKKMKTSGRHW